MTQQIINVGAAPNDGQGDPIRTAFEKCNNNFSELYDQVQTTPPATLVGSVGDVAGMTAYDSNFYYYCFQDFDGSSQIWNKVPNTGNAQVTILTATGNITGNYFIGDGSQLTNVTAASPTSVVNGTSNIVVQNSGNIIFSANATSNIVSITADGLYANSTVSPALLVNGFIRGLGNISGIHLRATGGGGELGNVIASGNVIGNTLVSNVLISGVSLSLSGNVTSNLNTSLNATIGGNLTVVDDITTTGYFIGDGGFLSNVTAVSNVAVTQVGNGTSILAVTGAGGDITVEVGGIANIAVFKSTEIELANTSVTNIFTDGYYYANGVPFSGSGGTNYSNANVAAYLPTYSGNIGGTLITTSQPYVTALGTLSELSVSGIHDIDLHAVASNIDIYTTFGGTISITPSTAGSINNMVIGATTPAAATFTNVVSSGNVTATYFIGDGSLLTNVGGGGSYGNADVAAYLPTYTGNIGAGNVLVSQEVSATGNVTGGNIVASGNANVTNTVTATKVVGQLTGTVNGVNTTYGVWDFGSITGTDFNSPIAWIFSQTSAGNVDMGTIASPSANNIDIGTIY